MLRPLVGRAAQALVTLALMSVVVFALLRVSGDPTELLLPRTATAETRARLRDSLNLNGSLMAQYREFVSDYVTGDFGESFYSRRPVLDLVMQRFWRTVQLATAALLFAVVAGVPLGVHSASHRGRLLDRTVRRGAAVAMAVPTFWLGIVMMLVIGVRLDLLPTSGYGRPQHVVMPAIALGLATMAGILTLTRSAMLEALESDYVTFARANGIRRRQILWRHALRNALVPVTTFSGILFAQMLAGATLVETLFGWPGLGDLAYTSMKSRDYPVVQGVLVFVTLIYVVMSILVDLAYSWLDPRIRTANR